MLEERFNVTDNHHPCQKKNHNNVDINNVCCCCCPASCFQHSRCTPFKYDPLKSNLKEVGIAIESIQKSLNEIISSNSTATPTLQHQSQIQLLDICTLRIHSLKSSYSEEYLRLFYNELMIPNFPLDDERDDLDDWIYCLNPDSNLSNECYHHQMRAPDMDILLLLCDGRNTEDNEEEITETVVMAGIAVEYYKQAQTGLLSYIVVSSFFRGLGIMSSMHPLALKVLSCLHCFHSHSQYHHQQLDKCRAPIDVDEKEEEERLINMECYSCCCACNTNDNNRKTCNAIKAVFAETNSITAGDISPEMTQKRHEILHQLGYRHLKHFPYVQPPLSEDGRSFDDIILLVYQGNSESNNGFDKEDDGICACCNVTMSDCGTFIGKEQAQATTKKGNTKCLKRRVTFPNGLIQTKIVYQYILDFYMSVFGYEEKDKVKYQNHWYYKLVTWYNNQYESTAISGLWSRVDLNSSSREVIANIELIRDGANDCASNGLPWVDTTSHIRALYEKWESLNSNEVESNENGSSTVSNRNQTAVNGDNEEDDGEFIDKEEHRHVVVIGAGVAGLAATVHLAENATIPIKITLVEANSYVGGRIRTILTSNAAINSDYEQGSNDNQRAGKIREIPRQYVISTASTQLYEKFAPWPIPIGAEFVHGVGSILNDLIYNNDWKTEETFDFCKEEEYDERIDRFTNRNQSSNRPLCDLKRERGIQVFGDGKCWNLNECGDDDVGCGQYPRLLKVANLVWDSLCDIRKRFHHSEVVFPVSRDDNNDKFVTTMTPAEDMSVEDFIENEMSSMMKSIKAQNSVLLPKESFHHDVKEVKAIIDSIYAKTAGTNIRCYGVNEACREEWSWNYTEKNWRTAGCFSELIFHYLDRINCINSHVDDGRVKVEVVLDCPVTSIASALREGNGSCRQTKVKLTTRSDSNGNRDDYFICDKTIVAVPLAVLKANKIRFDGEFALSPDKKMGIDKVNMLSGMKAHLLLRKGVDISTDFRASKPHNSIIEHTELFFCPNEIFTQIWIRRDENSLLLTGFVVANDRDELKKQIERGGSAETLFLEQIKRMSFDKTIGRSIFCTENNPTCSAFALHDWSDDKYVMGLYSSPSIGAGWQNSVTTHRDIPEDDGDNSKSMNIPAFQTCRHYLAEPINDSIFFAGEHTNTNTCASVQAALESGVFAAKEVLCTLGK